MFKIPILNVRKAVAPWNRPCLIFWGSASTKFSIGSNERTKDSRSEVTLRSSETPPKISAACL